MMSTVPFGSFLTTGWRAVQFRLNGAFSGLLHFWTLLYWVRISVMDGNNSRLRFGVSVEGSNKSNPAGNDAFKTP